MTRDLRLLRRKLQARRRQLPSLLINQDNKDKAIILKEEATSIREGSKEEEEVETPGEEEDTTIEIKTMEDSFTTSVRRDSENHQSKSGETGP